jgi:hypothetical protein
VLLWFALAPAVVDTRAESAAPGQHLPAWEPSTALTCPSATTLETLVDCIAGQMPGRDSEGFGVPDAAVQGDWRTVFGQMLDGACDSIALPASLDGIYDVGTWIDSGNGRSYCVAMEVLDVDEDGTVDHGWGTYIVDPAPERDLSIDVAHPLYDLDTRQQGIAVFKGVGARTFTMAGTHREASSTTSGCQSSYRIADVAHNVENLFFPAVLELRDFYDGQGLDFTSIQFHGMGTSSCEGVDVYLTHGSNTPPVAGDKVLDLRANLLAYHPAWVAIVPGDSPSCNLTGTTNVEGRHLNGVDAALVCGTAASGYTGRFIHIEQKRDYRDPAAWIDPIKDTFASTPLPTVTSITPSSGVNTGTVPITNLAGSNFVIMGTTTVALTKSGQTPITATNVTVVNESQITCDFDLTGAATGTWDVVVTTPDGQSDTLPNGFTITVDPGIFDEFVFLPLVVQNWLPTHSTQRRDSWVQ